MIRLKVLIEDIADVAREKMFVSPQNDDVTNFVIMFYRNWDKMNAWLKKLQDHCYGAQLFSKEDLFDLLFDYVDGKGANEWRRYLESILKVEKENERDALFYEFIWYAGCRVLSKEAKSLTFSELEKGIEKGVPLPHMAKGEKEYVVNKLISDESFVADIKDKITSEAVIEAVNEVFGADDVGKLILLLGVLYQTDLRSSAYPARDIVKLFIDNERIENDVRKGILRKFEFAEFDEYVDSKSAIVRKISEVLSEFDLIEYRITRKTIEKFVDLVVGLGRNKTLETLMKKITDLFNNRISGYIRDLKIKIKEKWSE